jgi:hypothetical protein
MIPETICKIRFQKGWRQHSVTPAISLAGAELTVHFFAAFLADGPFG